MFEPKSRSQSGVLFLSLAVIDDCVMWCMVCRLVGVGIGGREGGIWALALARGRTCGDSWRGGDQL